MALEKILRISLKDESFVELFVDFVMTISVLNPSEPDSRRDNSYEGVIDGFIEYFQMYKDQVTVDISTFRTTLIGMLKEKNFLAFVRVLRMLRDLFEYPEVRLVNYFKQFLIHPEGSGTWINVEATSKAIRDRLNPSRIGILAKLSRKQRSLLRGFNAEQINVLSKFSPKGIDVLLKLTQLPTNRRLIILGFNPTQIQLLKDFGIDMIRQLSNLQSDERDTFLTSTRDKFQNLRNWNNRDVLVLSTLTNEEADLTLKVHELPAEDRKIYSNLAQIQVRVLENLNDNYREILCTFEGNPSMREVFEVVNTLHSTQTDIFLSLNQEEIDMIVEHQLEAALKPFEEFQHNGATILRGLSILAPGEEDAILSLNQHQRLVLLRGYFLGHDGLFIIHELGLPLAQIVFDKYSMGIIENKEFSAMQMALMKKLCTLNNPVQLNQIVLSELLKIQGILLNLSWRGIKLLENLTNLDEDSIEKLTRLTKTNQPNKTKPGMEILTRNDNLSRTTIALVGELEQQEAEVLLNLNLKQRGYLSGIVDPTQHYSEIFTPHEQEVLENLSPKGKDVSSAIVPLSNVERIQLIGIRSLESRNPTDIDLKKLGLFATKTHSEMLLLSSFTNWHLEESVVFELLSSQFDRSFYEKNINRLPQDMSTKNHDNFFKLIAGTVETLRLIGAIEDENIKSLISMMDQIHGKSCSLMFKLNLLNFSMRDSKSLETQLVPEIVATPEEISMVYRTETILTVEDVMFLRWLLSRPGVFQDLARTSLTRLSNRPFGQELDIILSKSMSHEDGIEHQQIIQGFRDALRTNGYHLALSFFFTPRNQQISETLLIALHPDDCFKLLTFPAERFLFLKDRLTSQRVTNVFLVEGLLGSNVFEVSLYYDYGDPLPLMKMLDEAQLGKLLEKSPLLLLKLITRNCRTDILELYNEVRNVARFIETNRASIFEFFMQDLTNRPTKLSVQAYREIGLTIRTLAYLNAFVGKTTYVGMVSKYFEYLRGRVTQVEFGNILNTMVTQDVARDDLINTLRLRIDSIISKFLKTDGNPSCAMKRNRRDIPMICMDSESAEELMSDNIFDISMDGLSEDVKLYDQMSDYAKLRFQGDQADPEFEADPRITDLVNDPTSFKRYATVNRINEMANKAGLAFTVFLVGKHLVHGNVEDLGYDALNLWIMPKIGEHVTDMITPLAKGFAPVIGSAVSNLAAVLGLVQGIKGRIKAVDEVDKQIADLSIVSNSLFIAANVPAVAMKILSNYAIEMSVLGELSGPVGMALGVAIVATSYLIQIGLEVEKIAHQINLSRKEELLLYWNFFWDNPVPKQLQIDVTAKNIYEKYLSEYINRFKAKYDRIAVSLPAVIVTTTHKNTSYTMDFNQKVFAKNLFSTNHNRSRSRLIADSIESYDPICGPSANDAIEKMIRDKISLYIPSRLNDDCVNIVSFKKSGSLNSKKILIHLAQNATIKLSNIDSMDIIFYGQEINITDSAIAAQNHHLPETRFYFNNRISRCEIHRKGQNFFYLNENEFECDLGNRTEQQNNIIVIQKDFNDFKGINSIIGSAKREKIITHFAEFVDGKGGGDIIQGIKGTIVKGYFNDFILGECTILLPMNVNDIAFISAKTRMSVYDKQGSKIAVDRNTRLITTDGYLVSPIRISNVTDQVICAHIKKTYQGKIILNNKLAALRNLTIQNCSLLKQITSANCDIVLSDMGGNVFYMDKNDHEFYWEASSKHSNIYIIRKLFANVTISKANGVLDFQDLNLQSRSNFFHWFEEGEVKILIGELRVTLLKNYNNVTITLDGKIYFKLETEELIRDWCSHVLLITGRSIIDSTDLLNNYHNCFEFVADKILFLRLANDLILVAGREILRIAKYYTLIRGNVNLAIKYKGGIIEGNKFKKRANRPRDFVYYNVTNSGLHIYHNQPVDRYHIGFVDLKNQLIEDFEIVLDQDDLLLLHRDSTLVRIAQWNNYQPGREIILAFKDSFLANACCILSYCKPNDLIEEFRIAKHKKLHSRPRRDYMTNEASTASSWISGFINTIKTPIEGILIHSNGLIRKISHNDSNLNPFVYSFYSISNINLMLLLLGNFFNRKYPIPEVRLMTHQDMVADIMNFTEEYSMKHSLLDSFELYSRAMEFARKEEYSKISGIFKT